MPAPLTPLHQLQRQLYAARFRKETGRVFVEFSSAGKSYRVEVTSDTDAKSIVGTIWLRSHDASLAEKARKRRLRYRARKGGAT